LGAAQPAKNGTTGFFKQKKPEEFGGLMLSQRQQASSVAVNELSIHVTVSAYRGLTLRQPCYRRLTWTQSPKRRTQAACKRLNDRKSSLQKYCKSSIGHNGFNYTTLRKVGEGA
jgi:hypothetical protein